MKENFFRKKWVVLIGAMICTALWGSAYPAVKTGYILFGIDTAEPSSLILFAGMRFTLAGILAVLIGSAASKKFLIPKKGSMKMVLSLSMFQTVGQYVFFYISVANLSGVRSSILNGMQVFFAIIVSSFIFKQEKFTFLKFLGVIIGFAGLVIVCMSGGGEFEFSFTLLGDAFMIFSTIANAFSSALIKKFSQKENPVTLSGYQFFAGGIIMMAAGMLTGGKINAFSPVSALMLLYIGCISAVAYSLWGVLLKYNSVSKVTVFGFMIQIFGVLFSAIFLNETSSLNVFCLIALALVCTGIYLVNRQKG